MIVKILKSIGSFLLWVFLWPGSLVLKKINLTIEEDGGILRSFVNMCVWGVVVIFIVASYN